MGYPIEKKKQSVSRLLTDEITVPQASRQYGLGESTLYKWLQEARGSAAPKQARSVSIPLPRGMNLRAAIVAEGHCNILGMDSPETGQYCRAHGITLEELKTFSVWLEGQEDVIMASPAKEREQVLAKSLADLSAENQQLSKELRRKDKALAEAAALLVLTKKAQAIWGDKES